MTSNSSIPRLLLALALVTLLGCKQGEGDTCFEDDDCSGSLVCCKTGTSATERGTCLPPMEMCSEPGTDLGPPEDLGTSDLGVGDLGSGDLGSEDLGPEDMGSEDLGSEDLGPEDLGPEDLGPEDLGTEDAGA